MGTDKTSLGDRMKSYEKASCVSLMPRCPVILRLDGVAFHTLTRGFERPMDLKMSRAMNKAAIALCNRIQGAYVAYVQSDEISVLIIDYKNYESQAWFNKKLQKMVSVSAGIASAVFTTHLREKEGIDKTGVFDSRAIVLPKDEVVNYLIWRQQDCIRNSVQALGQANFSHKKLMHQDIGMIREMLLEERGISWEKCPDSQKQGFLVQRMLVSRYKGNQKTGITEKVIRSSWIANDAPLFLDKEIRQQIEISVYPEPPEKEENLG